MPEWLQTVVEWVKWLLVELPQPKNLNQIVTAFGVAKVYAILFAIIFAETGLLVGFCLPGDSLLFAAGALASGPNAVFNIFVLNVGLIVAAIAGDAVNYFLGRQMGEYVFEKGRLRFVKHEHLLKARDFYERHGALAIVLARFVPIVRTFTPFVAGVARMGYSSFAFYNITGGVGWVVSMTGAGYFLGQIPYVQRHFEKFVYLIIAVSVMPMVIAFIRSRWGRGAHELPGECRLQFDKTDSPTDLSIPVQSDGRDDAELAAARRALELSTAPEIQTKRKG